MITISCCIGMEDSLGIRIIEPPIKPPPDPDPIPEPPPPPPPTTTISGYVKESGTNEPLDEARVVLFGWEFVVDMYQQVQVGIRETNDNGYYSFTDVTADDPYSLVITKSGYAGYSGAYKSPVYLSKLYNDIRVTGKITESESIDNIQRTAAESLILDLTPEGMEPYDHAITTTSVRVSIKDCTGTTIKIATCNPTTGYYDTGIISARTGTITIRAYTESGTYFSSAVTRTVSEDATFNNVDLELKRNLGDVWIYSDSDCHDKVDNFQFKCNNYDGPVTPNVDIDFEVLHAPSLVYTPGETTTSYWISTNYHVQGDNFGHINQWYYGLQKARVTLYAKNYWTGDESFLSGASIYYEAGSDGSGQEFRTSFNAKVGYSPSAGLFDNFQASVGLGVTYNPSSYVTVQTHPATDEFNGWRRIGYVDIDYSNDLSGEYLRKNLVLNWRFEIDNSQLQALKQCGAHFEFKVDYSFILNSHSFLGWCSSDYCFYNNLTLSQIFGDGNPNDPTALNYPTYLVYTNYDTDRWPYTISYLTSDQSGKDLWMNLLAGEANFA